MRNRVRLILITTFSASTFPHPATPTVPRLVEITAVTQTTSGIAWSTLTEQGDPHGWAAQTSLNYDPTSGAILTYIVDANSTSIYSNTLFAVNVTLTTATFTRLGGTKSASNAPCYSDATGPVSQPGGWNNGDGSDVQPWPADRHPERMTTIVRSDLFQYSGLACGDPTVGQGKAWNDLWRWSIPAKRWTRIPLQTQATVSYSGTMVYVPGYDVIVLHGTAGSSRFPRTWVLCPVGDGRTLSTPQRRAGCAVPNDWVQTYAPSTVRPPLPSNPNLVVDLATNRVLLFTMFCEGCSNWPTEVWAYDIAAKTWTNQNPANPPLNQGSGQTESLVAYISSGPLAGNVIYHRTTHRGSGSGQAADFLYHPPTNRWIPLTSTGTGPENLTVLTIDPRLGPAGAVIAMEGKGGMSDTWWIGLLPAKISQ